MEAKSLGQIAYDAYGKSQAWLDARGHQMVSWPSLLPALQAGWEDAARAVAKAVTTARQQVEMQALEGTNG